MWCGGVNREARNVTYNRNTVPWVPDQFQHCCYFSRPTLCLRSWRVTSTDQQKPLRSSTVRAGYTRAIWDTTMRTVTFMLWTDWRTWSRSKVTRWVNSHSNIILPVYSVTQYGATYVTLHLWRHDVTRVLVLHVLKFALIFPGGTGGTGGDPAQSPWHRRRGGSRRPWWQGGRGTKGLRCSWKTWRLRGRRQEFRGSEIIGAQAAEGRCTVPHRHPQKPFWQDPTTATERCTVNVASHTLPHNSGARTKCCRLFHLLHPTYDQCAVCLWTKRKVFETVTLPSIMTYQRTPNLKHTQCKKTRSSGRSLIGKFVWEWLMLPSTLASPHRMYTVDWQVIKRM